MDVAVNNFLRLEAELGSGSLLTDEERAALHSLDNDGQLEERLLDPSDSVARAIDKLLYAKGEAKNSWTGSALFRVPQIPPDSLHLRVGDTIRIKTQDGFYTIGEIRSASLAEAVVKFDTTYKGLPDGLCRYSSSILKKMAEEKGWEFTHHSDENGRMIDTTVKTFRQEAVETKALKEAEAAAQKQAKRESEALKKRLQDPIERSKYELEQQEEEWQKEREQLGVGLAAWEMSQGDKTYYSDYLQYLNPITVFNPFMSDEEKFAPLASRERGDFWRRVDAVDKKLAAAKNVHAWLTRLQKGEKEKTTPTSALGTLPAEVRHLVHIGLAKSRKEALAIKLEAVKDLEEEGNNQAAMVVATGAVMSYATMTAPILGSVLIGPDGKPSVMARINHLIQTGVIKNADHLAVTSDELEQNLDRWWKDSIRFYPANAIPDDAIGGEASLQPFTQEELTGEIDRLRSIERYYAKEKKIIDEVIAEERKLVKRLGREVAWETAKGISSGLLKMVFDPKTLAMVMAGMASGPIGISGEAEALVSGLGEIGASAVKLAGAFVSFHTVNNLLSYGIDRRGVDWSPQAYANTGYVFALMGGVSWMFGKVAEATFLQWCKERPVLAKILMESGSLATTTVGFATADALPKVLDPDTHYTWDEFAKELIDSFQMAIAFRVYHFAEGERPPEGKYDKAIQLALKKLQGEFDRYQKDPTADNKDRVEEGIKIQLGLEGKAIVQSREQIEKAYKNGDLDYEQYNDAVSNLRTREQFTKFVLRTRVSVKPVIDSYIVKSFEEDGIFERLGRENVLALVNAVQQQDEAGVKQSAAAMGYDPDILWKAVEGTAELFRAEIVRNILRLPPQYTEVFATMKSGPGMPHYIYPSIVDVYNRVKDAKMEITPDILLRLVEAAEATARDIATVVHNSLGAITKEMAIEAVLNREKLATEAFHLSGERRSGLAYHVWNLGNGFEVKLSLGQWESASGLELVLSTVDDHGSSQLMGIIGFQMSDTGVEIVHHQGGKLAEKSREKVIDDFKKISGGVDPLPWLAFVAGRTLLDYTRKTGKQLRFIDGEWVVFCYPHVEGHQTPDLHSIDDARKYPWQSDPPPAWLAAKTAELPALKQELQEIEKANPELVDPKKHWDTDTTRTWRKLRAEIADIECALRMHNEGPKVVQRYRASAQNLGFRKGGKNNPWHRYTKSSADFGTQIRASAVDQAAFNASLLPFQILSLREADGDEAISYEASGDGSSFGNPTASHGPTPLFIDGHFDNAAARATAEPATPLERRGLFATNGDDATGEQMPAEMVYALGEEQAAQDLYDLRIPEADLDSIFLVPPNHTPVAEELRLFSSNIVDPAFLRAYKNFRHFEDGSSVPDTPKTRMEFVEVLQDLGVKFQDGLVEENSARFALTKCRLELQDTLQEGDEDWIELIQHDLSFLTALVGEPIVDMVQVSEVSEKPSQHEPSQDVTPRLSIPDNKVETDWDHYLESVDAIRLKGQTGTVSFNGTIDMGDYAEEADEVTTVGPGFEVVSKRQSKEGGSGYKLTIKKEESKRALVQVVTGLDQQQIAQFHHLIAPELEQGRQPQDLIFELAEYAAKINPQAFVSDPVAPSMPNPDHLPKLGTVVSGETEINFTTPVESVLAHVRIDGATDADLEGLRKLAQIYVSEGAPASEVASKIAHSWADIKAAREGNEGKSGGGDSPSPQTMKNHVMSVLSDAQRREKIQRKIDELGENLFIFSAEHVALAVGEGVATWDGRVYVPYHASDLEQSADTLAHEVGHFLQKEEGLLELNPNDYPGNFPSRLTQEEYETNEGVRIVYEADAQIFAKRAMGKNLSEADIAEIFRETTRLYGNSAPEYGGVERIAEGAQTFAARDHKSWPERTWDGIANAVLTFLYSSQPEPSQDLTPSQVTTEKSGWWQSSKNISHLTRREQKALFVLHFALDFPAGRKNKEAQKQLREMAETVFEENFPPDHSFQTIAEMREDIRLFFADSVKKYGAGQAPGPVLQFLAIFEKSNFYQKLSLEEANLIQETMRRDGAWLLSQVDDGYFFVHPQDLLGVCRGLELMKSLHHQVAEVYRRNGHEIDLRLVYKNAGMIENHLRHNTQRGLIEYGNLSSEGRLQWIENYLRQRNFLSDQKPDAGAEVAPRSLREKIEALKQSVHNKPLTLDSMAEISDLSKIPLTIEIAKLVLAERAAELKVNTDKLTVIVMGFGFNPVEVKIWLSLGVKVIAVESDQDARIALSDYLKGFSHDESRLEIKAELSETDRGDVVTWIYPMGSAVSGISIDGMTAPLKEGGRLIIETDLKEWFIDRLVSGDANVKYELQYRDNNVNGNNCYWPSIHSSPFSQNGFAIFIGPSGSSLDMVQVSGKPSQPEPSQDLTPSSTPSSSSAEKGEERKLSMSLETNFDPEFYSFGMMLPSNLFEVFMTEITFDEKAQKVRVDESGRREHTLAAIRRLIHQPVAGSLGMRLQLNKPDAPSDKREKFLERLGVQLRAAEDVADFFDKMATAGKISQEEMESIEIVGPKREELNGFIIQAARILAEGHQPVNRLGVKTEMSSILSRLVGPGTRFLEVGYGEREETLKAAEALGAEAFGLERMKTYPAGADRGLLGTDPVDVLFLNGQGSIYYMRDRVSVPNAKTILSHFGRTDWVVIQSHGPESPMQILRHAEEQNNCRFEVMFYEVTSDPVFPTDWKSSDRTNGLLIARKIKTPDQTKAPEGIPQEFVGFLQGIAPAIRVDFDNNLKMQIKRGPPNAFTIALGQMLANMTATIQMQRELVARGIKPTIADLPGRAAEVGRIWRQIDQSIAEGKIDGKEFYEGLGWDDKEIEKRRRWVYPVPPPPFHGMSTHRSKPRPRTSMQLWIGLAQEAVEEVKLKRKNAAKLYQVPESEVKLEPDEEALEAAFQVWNRDHAQHNRDEFQRALVAYHQGEDRRLAECLEPASSDELIKLLDALDRPTNEEPLSKTENEYGRKAVAAYVAHLRTYISERLAQLQSLYEVPHPQAGKIGKREKSQSTFAGVLQAKHPLIDPARSPKPTVVSTPSGTRATLQFCDTEGSPVAELKLQVRVMKGEKVLEIASLITERPDLEGKGIATAVIASVLQWAKQEGIRAVTLNAANDGVYLWTKKRFGFKPGTFMEGKLSSFGVIGVRIEPKRPSDHVAQDLQNLFSEWLATPEGEPFRSSTQGDYPKEFLSWIYYLTMVRDLRENPVTDAEIAALNGYAAGKTQKEIDPITEKRVSDARMALENDPSVNTDDAVYLLVLDAELTNFDVAIRELGGKTAYLRVLRKIASGEIGRDDRRFSLARGAFEALIIMDDLIPAIDEGTSFIVQFADHDEVDLARSVLGKKQEIIRRGRALRARPDYGQLRNIFVQESQAAPIHLRHLFVAHGTEVNLKKGEQLIKKGDDADAMYLIVNGSLRVVVNGRNITLTEGNVVGEIGVLEKGGLRTADVFAESENVDLLKITDEQYRELASATTDAGIRKIKEARLAEHPNVLVDGREMLLIGLDEKTELVRTLFEDRDFRARILSQARIDPSKHDVRFKTVQFAGKGSIKTVLRLGLTVDGEEIGLGIRLYDSQLFRNFKAVHKAALAELDEFGRYVPEDDVALMIYAYNKADDLGEGLALELTKAGIAGFSVGEFKRVRNVKRLSDTGIQSRHLRQVVSTIVRGWLLQRQVEFESAPMTGPVMGDLKPENFVRDMETAERERFLQIDLGNVRSLSWELLLPHIRAFLERTLEERHDVDLDEVLHAGVRDGISTYRGRLRDLQIQISDEEEVELRSYEPDRIPAEVRAWMTQYGVEKWYDDLPAEARKSVETHFLRSKISDRVYGGDAGKWLEEALQQMIENKLAPVLIERKSVFDSSNPDDVVFARGLLEGSIPIVETLIAHFEGSPYELLLARALTKSHIVDNPARVIADLKKIVADVRKKLEQTVYETQTD